MNYEQKYKEALERVRELMTNQNPPAFDKHLIETVFPELAENEDERIRKGIIALIEFGLDDKSAIAPGYNITKEEAIAWLEKQGEQKPETWCAEDEQNLNVVLSFISDECLRRWLKDKLCYDMKDAGYEWDAEKKELKKMPGEFTKLVHADFWDLIKTEHKMLDADKVIEWLKPYSVIDNNIINCFKKDFRL